MPLKAGHSREVVSSNIKEMVASGRPVKQAIAAALSQKRKYKKMAMGGEVDDEMGEGGDYRSLDEMQVQAEDHPDMVSSPDQEDYSQMLASALHKKAEDEDVDHYAMGGLVEGEEENSSEFGNMPSEEMAGETGEPMSSMPMEPADEGHGAVEGIPMKQGLSDEAHHAIMLKKKNRKFR